MSQPRNLRSNVVIHASELITIGSHRVMLSRISSMTRRGADGSFGRTVRWLAFLQVATACRMQLDLVDTCYRMVLDGSRDDAQSLYQTAIVRRAMDSSGYGTPFWTIAAENAYISYIRIHTIMLVSTYTTDQRTLHSHILFLRNSSNDNTIKMLPWINEFWVDKRVCVCVCVATLFCVSQNGVPFLHCGRGSDCRPLNRCRSKIVRSPSCCIV